MKLSAGELERVKTRVDEKVEFILSSNVYSELSEGEKADKKLQLTEKFLDKEFDRINNKADTLPPPPPVVH